MKTSTLLLSLLVCAFAAHAAEEKPVVPRIESVGLFKNGLAVIRATFPVSGSGLYRWDKVPRAVHGSFWMESDGQVSVQSTTRVVQTVDESDTPTGVLQQDLAGKTVTITSRSTGVSPAAGVKGVILPITPPAWEKAWDTDYGSLQPNGGSPWYGNRSAYPFTAAQIGTNPGNFLILTDAAGSRHYIDFSSIADIEVAASSGPVSRSEEKPVLVFDVREAPSDGGVVRVTWLAKGLAWMPAYQVDLTDPASLKIRQSAVVRNEMGDLSGTEVQLISGFPNVRFGAVDSPIWQGTTLAAFFQQVNQSGTLGSGALSNGLSQQMIYSNSASSTPSQALPDSGEQGNISDDIHYESIGKRDLKAGDSLSLDIASANSAYNRVVEWVIPDPRDASGRYRRDNSRGGPADSHDDLPWDAVRFKNPFKFPMTTASAVVMESGRFRGQSLSEWVNPGQSTCLRITRALTVHTESSEVEEEGQREIVWIGGNDYQRTKVKGRLVVRNYRATEASLVIRGEFSGELLEADEDPEKLLRAEGAYSVNPRRQLEWNLKLPAGEEKVLTYRYSLLVDR